MDAADACDVDLYDCDCELECCDGACEDTGDLCNLQDGLPSFCGYLICVDSDASGNVKDDKCIVLNKAISQALQVASVRDELTGISNSQPPSKSPETTSQVQLTSL